MANGIPVLRDAPRGPLSDREASRMTSLKNQTRLTPVEQADLTALTRRWQASQAKPAAHPKPVPAAAVPQGPMSAKDAARLAELNAGANAGRLGTAEQKEHRELQRRWQAAHAQWDHGANIPPAVRRPGVSIPKRRDPFGG